MFTSDSQPIIADSEYEVTKVLVKKDMHANRDILLLLKLQLTIYNSYERSELGLVAV
jgi:hypothetical protein